MILLSVVNLEQGFLSSGMVHCLCTYEVFIMHFFFYIDHQFYHKWALLTDPDDITGGPKGYLKCDIR